MKLAYEQNYKKIKIDSSSLHIKKEFDNEEFGNIPFEDNLSDEIIFFTQHNNNEIKIDLSSLHVKEEIENEEFENIPFEETPPNFEITPEIINHAPINIKSEKLEMQKE